MTSAGPWLICVARPSPLDDPWPLAVTLAAAPAGAHLIAPAGVVSAVQSAVACALPDALTRAAVIHALPDDPAEATARLAERAARLDPSVCLLHDLAAWMTPLIEVAAPTLALCRDATLLAACEPGASHTGLRGLLWGASAVAFTTSVSASLARDLLALRPERLMTAPSVATGPAICASPAARPAPPAPGDARPLRLLHLASPTAAAGLDVVLDALALLPPTTRLTIKSDAPMPAQRIQQQRLLGLRERVERVAAPTSWSSAFAGHDALILSASTPPPTPRPALEALAAGCPVIAADVTGARERLGDAALLVAPDDPAALAGAVRALDARGPELRRRGLERARQHAPARVAAALRGLVAALT